MVRAHSPTTECVFQVFGLCFSNKVDLGLLVTILIFLAGNVINSIVDRSKRRQQFNDEQRKESHARKRYLFALREEISLNIASLDKSIKGWPARQQISDFLRADRKNRILITLTFYSTIYSTRGEVLQDLPEILINNIVDFYGKLNELTVDASAIEFRAFETISDGGREDMFYSLRAAQEIALQQGKSIKDSISLHLADLAKQQP